MDKIKSVKKLVKLQQWQLRIQDFESSGMKLQDWLSLNNITRDTYYYWLRKCREASIENLPDEILSQLPAEIENPKPLANPCFKKLEVAAPVGIANPTITIKLGSVSVEVTDGISQCTLEAVLSALKATC